MPRKALSALRAAAYLTDRGGLITFYNETAARLWGYRPELGKSRWCGAWKLYRPDGSELPHDQSPVALALRGVAVDEREHLIAERPDGTRVSFRSYPSLLRSASGEVLGAVSILMDVSDQLFADEQSGQMASIIESATDAIIGKNLAGVITSWNRGAEQLFGYSAKEIIGKPVTVLIPQDRQEEEPAILARLRRGEEIDHYETVRQRKDGTLIDISLTVSPIKDVEGRIIGASKIARSIAERRRREDQQQMLIREMNHRVKNLLAVASSVVTLSARSATTPQELASAVAARLAALGSAHALTLPRSSDDTTHRPTTLHALIEIIASPYNEQSGDRRVSIDGSYIPISGGLVTSFALLLHEFFTNAAKYGALSTPEGRVHITLTEENGLFVVTWTEHGGPRVERTNSKGFGTILGDATIARQLKGEITRDWNPEGLRIRLAIGRGRLVG